ncbi:hypothetical protein [Butyrivibrio sp. LB2008]|uniref:hypothetical protein n=1 Tax=Butyrivibrio sp. LB2008 TaxID=1408305 RepID=UPI000568B106|nr:hypothetical protein [Butyrivibrio sp. LB2008]
MSFYDNDEIYLRDFEDKQFDAEKFKAFMDNLAQDIDGYGAKAMYLEAGYGKYYNNETYGGRAADASKEFIGNGQRDKLHVQNRNIQKELYMACADVKEAFEEMVDPSPKARISREVLRHIKKDHQGRYEEMDVLGCEIESMVREVINDFSDLTDFEYFDAKPVREIYDEFCGNGGCMDKCIQKLEMFDEYAESMMFKKDITGKSALLQDNIRNTAGALDAMKIYNPSIAHNSVGLVALGTNVSYLDNGLASLWAAASNGTKMNVKIFATDKDAAEYLDAQMKILCDDDDSNDADAIANINATVQGFLYMEVVDGKKYVAYDQEKIEGTLKHLEKGGLAYQLLSSVDEQIKENKKKGVAVPNAITKLEFGGRFENTKLEVRKDGAGVRLEVTSNNDLLPLNEIKHKTVAYAATRESALNYFKNGDNYDWDAISEWFKAKDDLNDAYHFTSIEYEVLAGEMFEMTDEEIESLFCNAQYDDGSALIKVSDKLGILIDRHDIMLNVLKEVEDDFVKSDKFTRAVLIDSIFDDMPRAGYINYVHISHKENSGGRNIYLARIDCCPGEYYDPNVKKPFDKNARSIMVYPYSSAYGINKNINQSVREINRKRTAVNVPDDAAKFLAEQTVLYAVDYCTKSSISLEYWTVKEMVAEMEKINNAEKLMSDFDTMDYGTYAHCMFVKGTVVQITEKDGDCVYVYNPEFDEKKLLFCVEAYNREKGTNYTVDEMIKEFEKEFEQDENGNKIGNSDIFDKYNAWCSEEEGLDKGEKLEDEMENDLARNKNKSTDEIDAMSVEEVEKYLEEH